MSSDVRKITISRRFIFCIFLLFTCSLNSGGDSRECKYVLKFSSYQNGCENHQPDPYKRIETYKTDHVPHESWSNLSHCSASQLKAYFSRHHYLENDIFSCHMLFMSNEFVKLVKTYAGYETAVITLHKDLKKVGVVGKFLGILNGSYCKGLKRRIGKLYREIQKNKHNKTGSVVCVEPSKASDFTGVLCEDRFDHKNLVNNIIPINAQEVTVNILENNDNQLAVAHELGKVSDQVFSNARHCKFVFVAEVESHVNSSIETIRTTSDRQVFIFHVAMVDRMLGDMQAQVDALVAGKPTLFERTPELFVRAIGKFFERLNPLVQAQELGGLVMDVGRGLGNALEHSVKHPIVTAQIIGTVTQQGIAFLRSTADFVSDITVGRLYLPEAEYQQRVDSFTDGINAMPVGQLKQLTAENWVDLGAHIAADFVFCKGFSSAFIYLKEIDAMSKVQQQAAKVGRRFKKAVDTHLADNPLLVTAEGVVLKMSKKGKDVGGAAREIISDSAKLIEAISKGTVDTVVFNNLKSIGNNIWQSPRGLIYGYDKKFGNTLNHTLAHMTPNPFKKTHTVFSIPKDKIVQLIDDAWMLKGEPLPSDPFAYIIDMKKCIGTNGETAIKVIVKKPGTCEILTAYPIII